MPHQPRLFNNPADRTTPVHVAALALRGVGQVYDMNLAATRVLLQTQARAASAFGFPDWSGLFDSVDDRARNVFSTSAATVAETLQHGLEELGTQASEGLNQLVETARQQAEEAERVTAALGEELRETVQQTEEAARAGSEDKASRRSKAAA